MQSDKIKGKSHITFLPLGDQAIIIRFSNEISAQLQQRILAFCSIIEENLTDEIIECVPTYTGVTVYYNQLKGTYSEIVETLKKLLNLPLPASAKKKRIVYIPVLYGYDVGLDLAFVAKWSNLTEQEVILLHSETEYLVHMIGFMPGFPYLGGLPKAIAAPRLAEPRLEIADGSVGIAGEQTGIYPNRTPGGWRIIGRTPVKLFDPTSDNPSLLKTGDICRFDPIAIERYQEIEMQIHDGSYRPAEER